MSKRIALVGLAALCAMAFSAVMAQGAFAAGETAYTCIPGAGEHNTDAHCDPGSTGTSGHVAITEDTQLTLHGIGNSLLKTKIAGGKVTLTATGVECVECMAHNQEVGGVMDVTGTGGHIRYTGVTISTAGCTVVNEEVNTEPLKVTTISANTAEVAPATEGNPEAKIHLNVGCTLGTEIIVTGHADGVATGATAKFATGAGELLVGEQEAKLEGEVTVEAGLTGGEHHPVALTAS